jgi:hypothetical protein
MNPIMVYRLLLQSTRKPRKIGFGAVIGLRRKRTADLARTGLSGAASTCDGMPSHHFGCGDPKQCERRYKLFAH